MEEIKLVNSNGAVVKSWLWVVNFLNMTYKEH